MAAARKATFSTACYRYQAAPFAFGLEAFGQLMLMDLEEPGYLVG
jgi:hypothetical protein